MISIMILQIGKIKAMDASSIKRLKVQNSSFERHKIFFIKFFFEYLIKTLKFKYFILQKNNFNMIKDVFMI